MGLKADIDELKEVWLGSSLLFKLVMGLSVFFTVSSVTSISDVIFKWKGFIFDAVEFYRDWMVEPIVNFAKHLDLHYSESSIDLLILGSIFFGGYIRALSVESNFSIKKEKYLYLFMCIYFSSIFGYYGLIGLNGQIMGPSPFDVSSFLIGALILPLFSRFENKIIYYFPFVCAVVVVLLLGGINEGITR